MTRARDLAAFVSNADGDIKFDTDTLFIDSSANRVGIGTTTPINKLTLKDNSESTHDLAFQRDTTYGTNTGIGGISWYNQAGDAVLSRINAGTDGSTGSRISFDTTSGGTKAERMRIDDSGNVGIGTSSPTGVTTTTLHINGTTNAGIHITDSASGATDSDGAYLSMDNPNLYIQNKEAGFTAFETSGTERMRIDSSGNLLVGKTSTSFGTAGILMGGDVIHGIRSGAHPLALNRLSDNGDFIQFYKDSSQVGSIGVNGSSSNIITIFNASGGNGCGLGMYADETVRPLNNLGNDSDNEVDLGRSATRFDDIFATNGTIQTSDEREKQQIASLTDAEITAAKAISKLFKTFKWNDSVSENGDNARTHTGVIAQQVETAMSDAGLDAGNYAFFISTTWWETQTEVAAVEADEENGIEAQEAYTRTDTYDTQEEAPEGATERNRKGIRYPELLSFIGAATEQRLTSIEARLDALEA